MPLEALVPGFEDASVLFLDVMRLPERYRRVIWLRFYENLRVN